MKSFGIYLAALFAGAALATGCYEDKGNYEPESFAFSCMDHKDGMKYARQREFFSIIF